MIRFDNLPPAVMQAMCTPMHQILAPTATTGALYIGSMNAVHDRELLRDNNVTVLVQCLDVPWIPPTETGLSCYRMDLLDLSTADLRPHLEAACNHIDKALRGGKNVLVHCQQGVSRSPAIVIAYLIRNHGMSYDAAYALCLKKRACIKPNSGFVRALQEWEGVWRRPNMGGRRFTS